MFPNTRLLIAALLGSVVALCGGFGIFAAFGVNHEPLSRLPADTVGLQLVASETAGPPPAWRSTSGFASSESDVRIDGALTETLTPLPVSRVTIERFNFQAVSAVRPQAMIDAQATMLRPHMSASLASLIPAGFPAAPPPPKATASKQAVPSTPIIKGPGPAASAAATSAAVAQQTSAAPSKPAPSAANAKPDTASKAAGKSGEPAPAAKPALLTVAAVEPAPGRAWAALQPQVTDALPEIVVPEPKPRPTLLGNAARRKLRLAALRRRLAARRRILAEAATTNIFQFGYQNSAFPLFRSAPASQRQTAGKRSVTGRPVAWSSSQ